MSRTSLVYADFAPLAMATRKSLHESRRPPHQGKLLVPTASPRIEERRASMVKWTRAAFASIHVMI